MTRFAKGLGALTTAGMFIILIMGAAVTNTGSEQGCGRSWPLCHGQFIPRFAVSTFIEFSHRAVVGVETPLVLLLAGVSLYLYRSRKEVRVLAPLMVVFLFLQAGLGAWAVMYPQMAAVLALHFGVSLIDFASVLLTTLFLFGVETSDELRERTVTGAFRFFAWLLAAYSYVVVYLGAYVRHIEADDACKGWPLCNGRAIPIFHGHVAANFAHRVAAGVLILAIVGMVLWTARMRDRRPDLFRASYLALGACLLQALAGATVVWTDMDIFSALAHAAGAGLLFGSLTYVCLRVTPRREQGERAEVGARRLPQSARAGMQAS